MPVSVRCPEHDSKLLLFTYYVRSYNKMFVIVEMIQEDTKIGTLSEVLNVWGPYPSREAAEQAVSPMRDEVRGIIAERGLNAVWFFLVRPIKEA